MYQSLKYMKSSQLFQIFFGTKQTLWKIEAPISTPFLNLSLRGKHSPKFGVYESHFFNPLTTLYVLLSYI